MTRSLADVRSALTSFSQMLEWPMAEVMDWYPPDEYLHEQIVEVRHAEDMQLHEFLSAVAKLREEKGAEAPDVLNSQKQGRGTLFELFSVLSPLYG